MNGPEHYREAERLLELAGATESTEVATSWQRDAQVHATLALAAATAVFPAAAVPGEYGYVPAGGAE